jgi:hypothetical protein
MIQSGWHRAEFERSKIASHIQVPVPYEDVNGGRYRIRIINLMYFQQHAGRRMTA